MAFNSRLRSSTTSRRFRAWLGGALVPVLFLCCSGWAQSTTAQPSEASAHKHPIASHVRHHRATPKTQKPPSPSDEAANPPQVTLAQGKLLVDAHNSDLNTILQDVAAQTGMTVDGLSRNTRVFGVYGPGAPRDVLSQLLTGAGYNFVMVGGAQENVPRELLLTAQNGNAMPPNPSRSPASQEPSQGDEDQNAEPLGPGAIAHPSPQDQDPDEQNSEERMQERLKNLQQMQKMIQQNQPPQQNQPNQQNPQPQPQ